MSDRQRAAVSWALAVLAVAMLAVGGLVRYADRTSFRSDPFADRVEEALERPAVRTAVARRLTNALISVRPNLLTARPLIEVAAESVVGTPAFRALVRRAAHDAHRAAFRGEADTPTLRVRDAAILIAEVLRTLSPRLVARIPPGVRVSVGRITGGVDGFMLDLSQRAEAGRRLAPLALAAALLLALAALLVSESRRAGVFRLGGAVFVVGGLGLLGCALAPGAASSGLAHLDGDAIREIAHVWVDPLATWAAVAALVGFISLLAAASVVRPVRVSSLARRARPLVTACWQDRRGRAGLLVVALVASVAMAVSPRVVLTSTIRAIGAVAVLAALVELFALGAAPSDTAPRARAPGRRTLLRLTATAGAAAIAVITVGALAAAGTEPDVAHAGRCNGSAALCDRPLDEVAFLGTHNSMAADRERGWLFAAQDAGIRQQLDDGVRALLVDTHYGFATRGGVLTELSESSGTRAKIVNELGETFVRTAERIRRRLGPDRSGDRGVYLCHGFCEVGATDALAAFKAVHRFLVTHPEEVIVLSIEDGTASKETAELIRRSGLIDEVYRGPARAPWPTLREMIDRDGRVLVLVEGDAGAKPWMHHQPRVAQETPYKFTTVDQLAASTSCEPNRGGTAGSLLLVNHWVDTPPAPRVTIAKRVNARPFLERRLSQCRARGRPMPPILAVDFYATGDAKAVVDELNGERRPSRP